MTPTSSHGPSYVTIWIWLVALLFAGLAPTYFPISQTLAVFLIFTVATTKVFLITRHFMHLKSEGRGLKATAIFPLVLIMILVMGILADSFFFGNYSSL